MNKAESLCNVIPKLKTSSLSSFWERERGEGEGGRKTEGERREGERERDRDTHEHASLTVP